MKLHLPISLRMAIMTAMSLACYTFTPSAQADVVLVPGVSEYDIGAERVADSSRLYDTGKGFYWLQHLHTAQMQFEQSGSTAFLGDLEDYLDNKPVNGDRTSLTEADFNTLKGDANTCWRQVASNVIQYWLDDYGVFYKGSVRYTTTTEGEDGYPVMYDVTEERTLPYGYTYDPNLLQGLGATQSLKVSMYMFDGWKNEGGVFSNAINWFMNGNVYGETEEGENDLMYQEAIDNHMGFFFQDYFRDASTVAHTDPAIGIGTKAHLKAILDAAFASPGQICYLTLTPVGGGEGHAITCYGYETAADGTLKGVYVVNSDDTSYRLFELYVNGTTDANDNSTKVKLFLDEDCKTEWKYATKDWYVVDAWYINTPDSLKALQRDYTTNALVWNGQKDDGTWYSNDGPTLGVLPTGDAGWSVNAQGEYFPSYYLADRDVEFGELALAEGEDTVAVTIDGEVTVKKMILSGTGNLAHLDFTGQNLAIVNMDELEITSSAVCKFSDITLSVTNDIELAASGYDGRLHLKNSKIKEAENLTVNMGSVLTLEGKNELTGNLVFEDGAALTLVNPAAANQKKPMLDCGGYFQFTENILVTIEGLTVTEGEFHIANFTYLNGDLTALMTAESSNTAWDYKDGSLILYVGVNSKIFEADGVWQDGVDGFSNEEGQHITIRGGELTVVGEVTPANILVGGGNDTTLSSAEDSEPGCIAGSTSMSKAGTGTLTINTENTFTGGIVINKGTVVAGSDTALGVGSVTLNEGTLDLGGFAVANDITIGADRQGTVTGAEASTGKLTLNGGSLQLDSDLGGALVLNGGSLTLGGVDFTTGLKLGSLATSNKEVTDITVPGIDQLGEGNYMLFACSEIAEGFKLTDLNVEGLRELNPAANLYGKLVMRPIEDTKNLMMQVRVTGGTESYSDTNANDEGVINIDYPRSPKTVTVTLANDATMQHTPDVENYGDNACFEGYTDLTKDGAGTLTMAETNPNWVGSVMLNEGGLVAGADKAFGDSTITMRGNTTLDLQDNKAANKLVVSADPDQTVQILGGDSYTGELNLLGGTIEGDTLRIARTASLRDGVVNVDLVGAGGIEKITDETVTLSGTNDYRGDTVVSRGTLIAGNAGAFGRSKVTVKHDSALDLAGYAVENNVTLSQESRLVNGQNALNVTVGRSADVGMDGYVLGAGQTLNIAGESSINGGITWAGGTLVLKQDTLTFTDVVQIQDGTVTELNIDSLLASGALLARSTEIELPMIFQKGIEGFVDGSVAVNVTGMDSVVTYDEVRKLLLCTLEQIPEVPVGPVEPEIDYPVALGSVSSNVSGVYSRMVRGDLMGIYRDNLADVAETIAAMDNAADVKAAVNQVNGLIYTTQMNAQIDGNMEHLRTVRDLMGYGTEAVRDEAACRFLVQATGGTSRVDSDNNAPGYTRNSYGGLLMMEHQLGQGSVIGASLNYEHADVDVKGQEKWKSDDTRFGIHFLIPGKTWQSRTIADIGLHTYDIKRDINVGNVNAHTTASPDGFSVNFLQEFVYSTEVEEGASIESFFRMEASYNSIDAITESGNAGNVALLVDGQDVWAATFTLGARYVQRFDMGGAIRASRFMVEAGVSHYLGLDNEVTARFVGDSGHAFKLTPAEREKWGATIGGSLLIPLSDSQMINCGARAQLRGDGSELNANVGYQLVF